jgi:hypothetical protein
VVGVRGLTAIGAWRKRRRWRRRGLRGVYPAVVVLMEVAVMQG